MARKLFGRIEKLKSGRFRARYVNPTDRGPKRIPAPTTFATTTAAQAWLAKQQAAIGDGTWVHPDDAKATQEAAQAQKSAQSVPFGVYAAKWVDERTNAKGQPIRPRTRNEYERLLGGVLSPWSAVAINAITPGAVRTWRASEMKRGTATQTARAYDLLKSILKTAVEDKLIVENPCKIKGGSTSEAKQIDPLTEVELDIIIETIDPRYKPLVIIAAAGGLRYGEVLALATDDVTIERTADGEVDAVRIRVNKTVTERPGLPREAGPTKTAAGNRTVSIFGRDATIVATHVESVGEGLLWTSTSGGYVPQSSVNNAWRKARKAAGREDLPFHFLRHYAGTRYAQYGATLAELKVHLGHTSVEAAMRYQHAAQERADKIGRQAARQ